MAFLPTYWVEQSSWRSVIPCAIPSPTWDLQGWERGIRSTTEAPGRGYYYSAGKGCRQSRQRKCSHTNCTLTLWGIFRASTGTYMSQDCRKTHTRPVCSKKRSRNSFPGIFSFWGFCEAFHIVRYWKLPAGSYSYQWIIEDVYGTQRSQQNPDGSRATVLFELWSSCCVYTLTP